jgi:IMP dehydrogenase
MSEQEHTIQQLEHYIHGNGLQAARDRLQADRWQI